MKKIIMTLSVSLLLSTTLWAKNYNVIQPNEVAAHLTHAQQQSAGFQSRCTYQANTAQYGSHQIQVTMLQGCQRLLAYLPTHAGGGIVRILGSNNTLYVRRIGYQAPPAASIQNRMLNFSCDTHRAIYDAKTGEGYVCP